MCQSCMDAVHSMKAYRNHARVPIDERATVQGPAKCPDHGEVLKYMCMDCNAVSCTDCMNFGDHKGHTHELITAIAEGQRNQLRAEVVIAEAAEATAAATAKAVEAVADAISEANDCGGKSAGSGTLAAAKKHIDTTFDRLRERNLPWFYEEGQQGWFV